jgi:hypothetical protein
MTRRIRSWSLSGDMLGDVASAAQAAMGRWSLRGPGQTADAPWWVQSHIVE